MSGRPEVVVVAWTHVGRVRARNEDAIALPGVVVTGRPPRPVSTTLVEGAGSLVAVIDGMGGHVGGAEASSLVARRLAHVGDDAERALAAVNDELYDEMDRRPELRSMGATVAAALVTPTAVEVCNVGDARAYSHVECFSTLVSVDDRSASGSGAITQSLGGAPQRTRVVVHRLTIPRDRPVRLLLCSDGLSDHVGFREIQEALDGPDPVGVVEHLVRLALAAGAPDNVSAVTLDVPCGNGGR